MEELTYTAIKIGALETWTMEQSTPPTNEELWATIFGIWPDAKLYQQMPFFPQETRRLNRRLEGFFYGSDN